MKGNLVKDEFHIYINILKYLLYWPVDSQNYFTRTAYTILAIIKIGVINVLYILVQCVTVYKKGENFSTVLETIFMLFTLSNYIVKVFYYTYSNGKIQTLLEDTGKVIFQAKNMKSKKEIAKTMNTWKIVFRFFMTACISAVLFWSLSPFINSDNDVLPFGYWYPFDVMSSPMYEFAFVYEVGVLSILVVTHVSLDALMVGIMAFAAGQLDILNETLRNLNNSDHEPNDKMIAEQIECINLHRNIKKLVHDLNGVITFPMFIQSTLGALILCTAMYKLSKVAVLSGEGLSIISYYMAMVTQLIIYFWYGNEVMWKSNELSKSAYECNWAPTNKAFKTNLLLFMLSTCKPLEVSGGYFVVLSLSPLLTILKCSWSYLAVLKTM